MRIRRGDRLRYLARRHDPRPGEYRDLWELLVRGPPMVRAPLGGGPYPRPRARRRTGRAYLPARPQHALRAARRAANPSREPSRNARAPPRRANRERTPILAFRLAGD